jgi:AcrR family transcriptional regulator
MVISTQASPSPSHLPPDVGGGDTDVTDGRLLRRKRNRDAVVGSLLDLFRAGNLQPSAEEIAARAGLSPRSLFRYFGDVDDLTRTAIARLELEAFHLVPVNTYPEADPAVKARVLAHQRFRLYEAVGHTAAVLRLRSPYHPTLAASLTRNRAFMRGQLRALFAPELRALGAVRGPTVLAAADVLCSFESYQLLHQVQRLSPETVMTAMADGLVALFAPGEQRSTAHPGEAGGPA